MKKILSTFLCLTFLLTLASLSVNAQGDPASIEPTEEENTYNGLIIGEVASATVTDTYTGGELDRLFHYYIPSSYTPGEKLPLMFTLHGSGFNGSYQLLYDSKFHELAEEEGFIVIAPNAVAIHSDGTLSSVGKGSTELGVSADQVRWNVGMYDPIDAYGVNDVSYLISLIDYFDEKGVVDTNRVFSSGLSHGACMSIRLAVEASDRFAGIGSVAGLLFSQHDTAIPEEDIKLVFIHGTADWVVPITGMIYSGWVFAHPLEDTISWFMNHYGMESTPVGVALEPVNPDDDTRITFYDYGSNGGTGSIVQYVVEGGGHSWPGGTNYGLGAAPVSSQISASEVIWDELKIDVSITPSVAVRTISDTENELIITLTKNYDNGVVDTADYTVPVGAEFGGTYTVEGIDVLVDPDSLHTVTVADSYAAVTGSGFYDEDFTVTIDAGTRSGYRFSGWTTSEGVTLKDANSAKTTFPMPEHDVTITANWSVSGGSSNSSSSAPKETTTKVGTATIITTGKQTVETQDDGSVTLPSGGTVTISDQLTATVPGGSVISDKGEVKIGSGSATITLPGGTVLTLPEGSTVTAAEIIIGKGGATAKTSDEASSTYAEGEILILDPQVPLGFSVFFSNPFSDVAEGAWYYDAVRYAYENKLMQGTGAETFAPDTSLSRAMMVQVLYQLEEQPAYSDAPSMLDVKAEDWYANAMYWSAANGIINGYGDGIYAPEDNITREQMAVILDQYCDYKDITLPATRSAVSFADSDVISDWALDAVNAMYQAEILSGKGGDQFDPQSGATRAEVAQMFMNFLTTLSA